MIEASIIADSISPQGKRIVTYKLRYPKFIHGEFMTHRVISRNASSSRAIPTSKLIEEVRSDALRAGPVFWGKNQSGMQAAEELSAEPVQGQTAWMKLDIDHPHFGSLSMSEKDRARALWSEAAGQAAHYAEFMHKVGVHKQIVNRLLEPFSHINVVATATEWDNFFGLRLHKDAQPEMLALASAMWEARKASTPRLLKPEEWHLPFVDSFNNILDYAQVSAQSTPLTEFAIKVSVARCARVSYESFETGKRSTVEEDLKLYDRLVGAQPLHASPAEHQATPDNPYMGGEAGSKWQRPGEHGNFVGWRQYRKMLPGEAVAPLPEGYQPWL